jgi:hypothetical protein
VDRSSNAEWGKIIFFFFTRSRLALGVIHPVKWVPGSFTWVKVAERGVDHSPLSGTDVNNEWSYTSLSPYALMAWSGTTLLFPRTEENVRPQGS